MVTDRQLNSILGDFEFVMTCRVFYVTVEVADQMICLVMDFTIFLQHKVRAYIYQFMNKKLKHLKSMFPRPQLNENDRFKYKFHEGGIFKENIRKWWSFDELNSLNGDFVLSY